MSSDLVRPAIHFADKLTMDASFAPLCHSQVKVGAGRQYCAALNLAGHAFVCGLAWNFIPRFRTGLKEIETEAKVIVDMLVPPPANNCRIRRQAERVINLIRKFRDVEGESRFVTDNHNVFSKEFPRKESELEPKLRVLEQFCQEIQDVIDRGRTPDQNDPGVFLGTLDSFEGYRNRLDSLLSNVQGHFAAAEKSLDEAGFGRLTNLNDVDTELRTRVDNMAKHSKLWHDDYL